MKEITILGIDLAKRNFHIVGVNEKGLPVLKKGLKRDDLLRFCAENVPLSALVAMEACGGCHYWAQQFRKAGFTVKLLKPRDVKPYANARQKNDINDALAITKAANDVNLREVYIKSRDAQEIALLHKIRQRTIANRVQATNSLMSSLLEFGFDVGCGKTRFLNQMETLLDQALREGYISSSAYELLEKSVREIRFFLKEEDDIDKILITQNKTSPKVKILETVPGLGPVISSCLSGLPIESYEEGKDFAASLGIVPTQHTTGGHIVLGCITKRGNRYARTLLIQGARCLLMCASKMKEIKGDLLLWAYDLYQRVGFNKASVGVANKLARIAHACLTQNVPYDPSRLKLKRIHQ